MTRFFALFILCFSSACAFNPSAFVCEDGEPSDGTRDCKNGVWVQRTSTTGPVPDAGDFDAKTGKDVSIKDMMPTPSCGDGRLDEGEKCDTTIGGETCVGLGFIAGTLTCADDCTFETMNCEAPPTCGDGVFESEKEECDPSSFGVEQQECGENFDMGRVKCTDACILDRSECSQCGNGIKEGAEECDGNFSETCDKNGDLACVKCTFDRSGCFDCGDGQISEKEICDSEEFNGQTCESINGAGSLGTLSCEDECQTVNDADCGIKYVQVSAGRYFSCGLQSDGLVKCWGANNTSQSTPPITQFEQIAAGGLHVCGLRGDGRVNCWGSNQQAFSGFSRNTNQSQPPADLFKSITSGRYHSCGIRLDDTVRCWGSRRDFDDGEVYQNDDRGDRAIDVSAGGFHTCSVRADGTADCWGRNAEGQTSPPVTLFTSISVGDYHSCALNASNQTSCWGSNFEYLGSGGTAIVNQNIPSTTPFTKISSGGFHTCGLKLDGAVECWGSNSHGQSAFKTGPFTDVSAGRNHTCGLLETGLIECSCPELNHNSTRSNFPSLKQKISGESGAS